MAQGYYTLRLTLIGGGRTRLDCVRLSQSGPCAGVGDTPTTWGQIKALWR
jgi:hypothetical protein